MQGFAVPLVSLLPWSESVSPWHINKAEFHLQKGHVYKERHGVVCSVKCVTFSTAMYHLHFQRVYQIHCNSSFSWLSFVYLQTWLTYHFFFPNSSQPCLDFFVFPVQVTFIFILSNFRKNVWTRWFSNSFGTLASHSQFRLSAFGLMHWHCS